MAEPEVVGVKGSGRWARCLKCGKSGLVDDRGLPIHRSDLVNEAVCCTACKTVFQFTLRYLRWTEPAGVYL